MHLLNCLVQGVESYCFGSHTRSIAVVPYKAIAIRPGVRRDEMVCRLRDPPLECVDGVSIKVADKAFLVAEEHGVFLERHEPPWANDATLHVNRFVAESHLRAAVLAFVFH